MAAAAQKLTGFTCAMQETDGKAFLVRSINNQFVGISQLDDSYTNTTGLVSVAPRVIYFPFSKSCQFENHVAMLCLSTGAAAL